MIEYVMSLLLDVFFLNIVSSAIMWSLIANREHHQISIFLTRMERK